MIINLSPSFGAAPIAVTKVGDLLEINGASFDFSSLPEGAELEEATVEAIPGGYFTGPVRRVNGDLSLTMILPYASENPSPAVAFPSPIIDPPDGVIVLPEDAPPPEEEFIEPPHGEENDDVDA